MTDLSAAAREDDDDPAGYLKAATLIDSDDPAIGAYARAAAGSGDDTARAVRLYYAVRDEIRYDPYDIDVSREGFRASRCLARRKGFCITKAALLAACGRAEGIPSRVGYGDVRNHLATPKLIALMGSDLFVFHGFTEFFLEGRWVKATPAFNLSLCTRFGVKPLEFDGTADSLFHPFDAAGRRHMEYVRQRGAYADVPLDEISAAFHEHYPRPMKDGFRPADGDFEREAEAERDT